MNKQNKVIVGVIALILTLTIGYAVLTQSINIKGTATAKAEFGLVFENSSESPTCVGFSGECTNSSLYSITGDKNDTLNITVDKLNYPTAYVTIPVVIKNIGTVDAELKNMNIDVDKNREDISITYTGISNNEVLKAKEQREMLVKVEWTDTSVVETAVVTFQMSLSYAQKAVVVSSSSSSSGGDSGDTGETEDWTYKVNSDGLITAYNYAKGTDIEVPDKVDGIPVKTINKESFLKSANGKLYFSSDQKYYILINEKGNNYTTVRTKLINYFMSMCSSDDNDCKNNLKTNIYTCSDENTCYNVSEEESGTATKSSVPSDVQLFSQMSVDTDPNVSVSDSISQPKVNVTSLDLSKATNLTTIEEESFKDSGLTSVTFGDNSKLENIGNNAFSSNKISTLKLPDSITKINNYVFSNNQISSLMIPGSVTTIESSAFSSNQISSLTFAENSKLTVIGDSAFSSNQINSLMIPESVTAIESFAFSSNQISNLKIPKTVNSLGSSVFSNNLIETLSIEKCTSAVCGYYNIGDSIKKLTIESGEIGDTAFQSSGGAATNIEELTLGEEVTAIGNKAFLGNQISSVIIPESVTTIGDNAFSSIKLLSIKKCTTEICKNSKFGTSVTNLTIESGEIGDSAFTSSSTTKIEKLTLGEGVTTIGSSAFKDNQISSLTIPNSVITIGRLAFSSNQISSLTFAENSKLETIEESTFVGNQISSLIIPNSVTAIGDAAFHTNQISSLTIPKSVTTIGSSAFLGNQISELTIPGSVTTIESSAFSSNQISELIISENSKLTTIGVSAFYSNQISSLTIPKSVTTIGTSAFYKNPLTSILIKRTEEDFKANVTVGSSWYDGTPTITYEP